MDDQFKGDDELLDSASRVILVRNAFLVMVGAGASLSLKAVRHRFSPKGLETIVVLGAFAGAAVFIKLLDYANGLQKSLSQRSARQIKRTPRKGRFAHQPDRFPTPPPPITSQSQPPAAVASSATGARTTNTLLTEVSANIVGDHFKARKAIKSLRERQLNDSQKAQLNKLIDQLNARYHMMKPVEHV